MTKQDQIKKACRKAYNELVEQGKRPTVNAVSSLVTGDRNAISKALKALREEYQVDENGRSNRLPGQVVRAMEQVYLNLKGSIEDESQLKIQGAQDALKKTDTQNSLLEGELEAIKLELSCVKGELEDKKVMLDAQNSQIKNNEINLARLGTLSEQQQQQISTLQLSNKEMLNQMESERIQTRHQITHMLEQGRELKDEKEATVSKYEALKYQFREYKMDTGQRISQLEADIASQSQAHQTELSELKLIQHKQLSYADVQAQTLLQEKQESLKAVIQAQLKVIDENLAHKEQLEAELKSQRQKEIEINNVQMALKNSLAVQEDNHQALIKLMQEQRVNQTLVTKDE